MKLFDTLYYSIYSFGRSIRQPHLQAKALAGICMPAFFISAGFFLYCIVTYKLDPKLFPPKNFKAGFEGLGAAVFILSYIFYVRTGRGQRIISEYEKSKNQRIYVWLGAIFSLITVSLPISMWFLLRAIM